MTSANSIDPSRTCDDQSRAEVNRNLGWKPGMSSVLLLDPLTLRSIDVIVNKGILFAITSKGAVTMTRTYRGTAQAEVAALNSQRMIEAALALFEEQWIDQIALEHVAQRAGVTVPTILRHFGSKEGLLAAAGRAASDRASEQRAEAPAGDLEGAVDNLVEHYESTGDRVIRLLAQEGHYAQLHELLQEGRAKHREWVERVFRPYISQRIEHDRPRLVAELVALCDVQTWKLLRRDSGLSRNETRLALLEMLTRLMGISG